MTFKPERGPIAGLLAALLLLLAGCDRADSESSPLESAKAQLARGEALAADLALERMMDHGTPQPQVAAYRGEAALMRGDLIEARYWLAPQDFDDASLIHGLRMLAQLEIRDENVDAAKEAYRMALELAPDDSSLWVDVGRLQYRTGEQLNALESAKRAIDLDENNFSALLFRGQIARDAQGPVDALTWFERARNVAPDAIEPRLQLAATLIDAGQPHDGIDLLETGDEALEKNPLGLYLRAVGALRTGDLAASSELLARSGRVSAGMPSAIVLSAVLDIRRGNYASAQQALDRLALRQPDNGRIRELLALTLARNGEDEELVRRFALLARGLSGSPYLRTLVGRAYETLEDRQSAAFYLDLAAQPQRGLASLPPAKPVDVAISRGQAAGLEMRNRIRLALARGNDADAALLAQSYAQRFPFSVDALMLLGDASFAAGNNERAWSAYGQVATVRQPWSLALKRAATAVRRDGSGALLVSFTAANPNNPEAAALAAESFAAAGEWEKAANLLDRAIAGGQRRVPWVLAARSVAARQTGNEQAALDWALEAHDLQPMNVAATEALIAALPRDDAATRSELEAKLASLTQR